VLYLFLLWMARSALQGPAPRRAEASGRRDYDDATGMHAPRGPRRATAARRSCAWSRRRPAAGSAYDSRDGALLGRGDQADIRSRTRSPPPARAARPAGGRDGVGGPGLDERHLPEREPLRGPQPLHVGDRIRIGDSEFTFER
jgi:hypothetical protein